MGRQLTTAEGKLDSEWLRACMLGDTARLRDVLDKGADAHEGVRSLE